MDRERVEKYKGRIIIKDGQWYMTYWSNKQYDSLEEVRAAIDSGEAYDGRG